MRLAAGWVGRTDLSAIDTGLAPEEALRRVPELLRALREAKISATETRLDNGAIDVLHAACRLLPELEPADAKDSLKDARNLYELIEKATWPEPDFEERVELLADCAFAAWRLARKTGTPAETDKWERRFLSIAGEVSSLRSRVDTILATTTPGHIEQGTELRLEDPELILLVCQVLRSRGETSPMDVRQGAESLYGILESFKGGIGISDEHEYFLGEVALIAGTQCRTLSQREEARRWFDRAEGYFRLTPRLEVDRLRLSYQRLALRLEERAYKEVLEMVPLIAQDFMRLGMAEEALKCQFLEGLAYQETGQSGRALSLFEDIAARAGSGGYDRLLAHALNNLFMLNAKQGRTDEALRCSNRAFPALNRLGNRIGMIKLRWNLGDLLKVQGNTAEALNAYHTAREEAQEIGLRGEVAALHLVVADLLLEQGLDSQAEWEVRAALPIIDEEKMVPEGYAALSLLRQSLRRRQIDRQALRNLHGYFRESES